MRVRPITLARDYPTVSAWWAGHQWAPIPEVFLPEVGLMAETDEGEPQAAGWLYFADTAPIAMLEWVVTNPAAPALQAARALEAVVSTAKARASEAMARVCFTTCRQASLTRFYERHGFGITDPNVTHLLAVLR